MTGAGKQGSLHAVGTAGSMQKASRPAQHH